MTAHRDTEEVWPEVFATDYDARVAMTEDIPFYVGLAAQANGPVVELAVGTGRVAVPVAEAIGRPVVGIDSSPGRCVPTVGSRGTRSRSITASRRGTTAWSSTVSSRA